MHIRQALAVVLVVVVLVTAVTPARAEALEPMTALAIAGAAVAVVILVAYLVVANLRDAGQPSALVDDDAPVLVAFSRQANAESP